MDNKQYDNERKGVLFLKGSENPKAPKWDGKMTLNGVEYKIAAWEKTSASGKEMLTISISDKQEGGNYANSPKKPQQVPPAYAKHYESKADGYAPNHREDDGEGIPF